MNKSVDEDSFDDEDDSEIDELDVQAAKFLKAGPNSVEKLSDEDSKETRIEDEPTTSKLMINGMAKEEHEMIQRSVQNRVDMTRRKRLLANALVKSAKYRINLLNSWAERRAIFEKQKLPYKPVKPSPFLTAPTDSSHKLSDGLESLKTLPAETSFVKKGITFKRIKPVPQLKCNDPVPSTSSTPDASAFVSFSDEPKVSKKLLSPKSSNILHTRKNMTYSVIPKDNTIPMRLIKSSNGTYKFVTSASGVTAEHKPKLLKPSGLYKQTLSPPKGNLVFRKPMANLPSEPSTSQVSIAVKRPSINPSTSRTVVVRRNSTALPTLIKPQLHRENPVQEVDEKRKTFQVIQVQPDEKVEKEKTTEVEPEKYVIPQDLLMSSSSDRIKKISREPLGMDTENNAINDNCPDLFVMESDAAFTLDEQQSSGSQASSSSKNRRKTSLVPKTNFDDDMVFEEENFRMPPRPSENIELIETLASYRVLVSGLLKKLQVPPIDFSTDSDDYINTYKIFKN